MFLFCRNSVPQKIRIRNYSKKYAPKVGGSVYFCYGPSGPKPSKTQAASFPRLIICLTKIILTSPPCISEGTAMLSMPHLLACCAKYFFLALGQSSMDAIASVFNPGTRVYSLQTKGRLIHNIPLLNTCHPRRALTAFS